MTKEEYWKAMRDKYDLTESAHWFKSKQGWVIITRPGIEKIQRALSIRVEYRSELIDIENGFAVIKAEGEDKFGHTCQTYGEANPANNRTKYPVAMAEKRALSRCVLKLEGAYEHGILGEDEIEEP